MKCIWNCSLCDNGWVDNVSTRQVECYECGAMFDVRGKVKIEAYKLIIEPASDDYDEYEI